MHTLDTGTSPSLHRPSTRGRAALAAKTSRIHRIHNRYYCYLVTYLDSKQKTLLGKQLLHTRRQPSRSTIVGPIDYLSSSIQKLYGGASTAITVVVSG